MEKSVYISSKILLVSILGSVALSVPAALAEDINGSPNLSVAPKTIPSFFNYSRGNDSFRFNIAPNYSEKLGWSMKGAVGSYLTNQTALALIAEYGKDKREYLTNAGVQLTDALSFIGTVGLLEENNEYVAGDGKKRVQQLEYGASIKGSYRIGVYRGFELNSYLADANSKSANVETGKLYGAQFLTKFNFDERTNFKIGGGYEWLSWDEGESNDRFAFSAMGDHKLTDKLRLEANVKFGASEYVYGSGLFYQLSHSKENSNTLALTYQNINGQHGIENDQRVELGWTIGFGDLSSKHDATTKLAKNPTLTPLNNTEVVSSNNLLNEALKRPNFLPERVLARASALEPENDISAICESFKFKKSTGDAPFENSYTRWYSTYAIYPEVDPMLLQGRNINVKFQGQDRIVKVDLSALEFDRASIEATGFRFGDTASVIIFIDGKACPALEFESNQNYGP